MLGWKNTKVVKFSWHSPFAQLQTDLSGNLTFLVKKYAMSSILSTSLYYAYISA